MKTQLFTLAALALIACQQNRKEAPVQEENIATNTQEEQNAEVENDWKEKGLKGKVKVLTEIVYWGVEKNGQLVKGKLVDEYPAITRTYFNLQGFITLLESFESLPMNQPVSKGQYLYDEYGRLSEVICTSIGSDTTKYSYLYNSKGDRTFERMENTSMSQAEDKEYYYIYTPEGKQKTIFEDMGLGEEKTISYYNKKNQLIKEEEFNPQEILTRELINTYNDKGQLIKTITKIDNQERVTTFTYDSYGNITAFKEQSPKGSLSATISYKYDTKGYILQKEEKVTTTYEDQENYTSHCTYTYDSQGNILTATNDHAEMDTQTVTEYTIEYYQ